MDSPNKFSIMPSNGIVKVTSDHPNAAMLPVTAGERGNAGVTTMFNIVGMADVDPLALGNFALVTEHTAMTIPAYYSGVRFIAETIAGLPKHVYQKTATGPKRMDTHPAEWTMESEPSNLNTPFTFWSTFIAHAVNWSNAFAAYKAGPGDAQLFNLPPDRMCAFKFDGKIWYLFDLERPQKENDPNSRYLVFAAEEMIHLPALSFDGMAGMPMVQLMQGTLRTAKQTEAFVGKYFGQGGLMRGTLETDKELTAEKIAELSNLISNKYSGVENAHKWMILGYGLKAKTLTAQLDTAQTEENRKFSVQEVCRMLRVPPHVVYELGKATWANIESLGIEVVKYTLNNWIVPLEQELTRKMLTRAERKAGHYIRFEVGALLRGDHAAQIDAAVKRVSNGLTTPDEERAAIELPPYPNGMGAMPRVPANTVSLDPEAEPATAIPAEPNPDDEEDANEDLNKKLAPLIADAASRVDGAVLGKLETAKKKNHIGTPEFVAWANVFAEQQAAHADEAVKPIVLAFNLQRLHVGAKYSVELRKHFAAINRGEQSTPPSLAEIFKGELANAA